MNHLHRATIFCVLFLLPRPCLADGVVFSVRPGFGLQSSHVGLTMGRLTPYIGLDLFHVGAKVKNDQIYYSLNFPDQTPYKSQERTDNLEASATMIIPHIGVKLNLSDPDAKLHPYLLADFFKAFSSIKADGREEWRYYNPQGQLIDTGVNEYALGDDQKQLIESLLDIYGVTAGFGVEYPFSDNFTVGGEYGVRLIFSSGDGEGSYDPDFEELSDRWKTDLSASFKMSYAVVTLNFYFR